MNFSSFYNVYIFTPQLLSQAQNGLLKVSVPELTGPDFRLESQDQELALLLDVNYTIMLPKPTGERRKKKKEEKTLTSLRSALRLTF